MAESKPLVELVGGTRPNFMKLAPVLAAVDAGGQLRSSIVHTGQHYDANMSAVFFEELGIRQPDVSLEVGAGSQAVQTARILERYATHLEERRPDLVVVFGDVNSTMACALAATKLQVPVAHVEAGLRSGDRSMPEEINRLVTDAVADYLLASEPSGMAHLAAEGCPASACELVGNTMIDSLVKHASAARRLRQARALGIPDGPYGLVTMHRPSNVDAPEVLRARLGTLATIARELPLVFPVHPRTRHAAERAGVALTAEAMPGMYFVPPQPYRSNLSLMMDATVVMTDSGGMQEECAHLRVPCLVMRDSTERPVTVDSGACRLVADDAQALVAGVAEAVAGDWGSIASIPLWDGRAGERIAAYLADALS